MLRRLGANAILATDVALAIDVAASELHRDGRYRLSAEQRAISPAQLTESLCDLAGRFPLCSIEDALDQDDWDGWSALPAALPNVQLVGDDLFATNLERVQRGIGLGVAHAALIKLNQNGTLSGTLAVVAALRGAGLQPIVAARSGDTEDTFVADLAVAVGAGQIKLGALRNTERMAKYNQLLRIEQETELPCARFRGPASGA